MSDVTPRKLLKGKHTDVVVKVRDIINGNEPLQRLAMQPFTVMLSYKIALTLKGLDDVVEKYGIARKKLLDEYGKIGQSGQYEFEGDKEKEVTKLVNDLLDADVTVQIYPITLYELGKIEIEPRSLALLTWYISE